MQPARETGQPTGYGMLGLGVDEQCPFAIHLEPVGHEPAHLGVKRHEAAVGPGASHAEQPPGMTPRTTEAPRATGGIEPDGSVLAERAGGEQREDRKRRQDG